MDDMAELLSRQVRPQFSLLTQRWLFLGWESSGEHLNRLKFHERKIIGWNNEINIIRKLPLDVQFVVLVKKKNTVEKKNTTTV